MQTLTAAKNGRYVGAGDPLDLLIAGKGMGEHWFPANPVAQYKHWYGFQESAKYNSADFTTRNTGAGSATAMTANGLQLLSGSAASTDDAQLQAIRNFTPAAGKRAIAFCRFQIDDIAHPLFFFGWSNTVTDWGAGEGTHNAAFLMAAGGATVVGRSKDGTTGSSTATIFTAVAATDYDLCVVIDGVSAIEYRWKLATTTSWTTVRKTTNLPTAAQRFTVGIGSGETAAHNIVLARYGFWAEHTNVL